jgi:hypothetical protein
VGDGIQGGIDEPKAVTRVLVGQAMIPAQNGVLPLVPPLSPM